MLLAFGKRFKQQLPAILGEALKKQANYRAAKNILNSTDAKLAPKKLAPYLLSLNSHEADLFRHHKAH